MIGALPPAANVAEGATPATPARRRVDPAALVVFALALAVRLALVPQPGNVSDISGLIQFGAQVAAHGPQALYEGVDPTQAFFTYTPLFPDALALTFRVWSLLSGHVLVDGAPPYTVAAALAKGWILAGDLALGMLIYGWVRRRAGSAWARFSLGAFLLNPGVLYDGAWWGQIDCLLALCAAGAITAVGHDTGRWPWRSWLWLAAGMLLKPQAVVAAPLVALATLQRGGVRPLLLGALAAAGFSVVLGAPFLLTGRAGQLLGAYLHAGSAYPQVSVNAYNAWWAAGGPGGGGLVGQADTARLAAGLTHREVGLAGFLALLALAGRYAYASPSRRRVAQPTHQRGSGVGVAACERIPQSGAAWALAAAGAYYGFFMLPTQIHERYLYPALPLLCLVLYMHPAVLAILAAATLAYTANLVHVVPWTPSAALALDVAGLDSWRVALLHCGALAALVIMLVRPADRLQRWTVQRAMVVTTRAAALGATAPLVVFDFLLQAGRLGGLRVAVGTVLLGALGLGGTLAALTGPRVPSILWLRGKGAGLPQRGTQDAGPSGQGTQRLR